MLLSLAGTLECRLQKLLWSFALRPPPLVVCRMPQRGCAACKR